jgi:hypothetical protein
LPAQQAANAITDAAQNAGQLNYPRQYFYRGTLRNVMGQRSVASQLKSETPSLPTDLAGRLEGRKTQTDARAYREQLKRQYPQAAASIDKHLSDAVIKQLWPMKG